MKKIGKLRHELRTENLYSPQSSIDSIIDTVNALVELLEPETKCACNKIGPCTYHYLHPKGETETVKGECRCRSGELNTGGKWASWSKDNCPVHPDKSPFDKEEPTTPEKKCCDCFGKEPISLGVVLGGGEFKCQCKCHKEKLPSERIFEIREKGGKEVLPSNGEEYYVMPIAKAIMMYLDEQYKKK